MRSRIVGYFELISESRAQGLLHTEARLPWSRGVEISPHVDDVIFRASHVGGARGLAPTSLPLTLIAPSCMH
jgi:hypothetical protein